MISSTANRRLRTVTNSPTAWLLGLVLSLGALVTLPSSAARAQEPAVVEPNPVVEPEPVVEQEAAEESSRATPVVDPPSRVARLGYVEGEVTVAPAGTDDWAEAVLNRPLTSGDRLWVESGGRAELQIGSAAVYLDGDTGFGFIELDDGVLQSSLTEGAATIRVRRMAEGETIQVETPHSTVVLKRVGEYHLEIDKSADRTIVKTRNGKAEVKGGNQHFTVRDNERGIFTGLETLEGRIEPLGPRTAFENWANDRDARHERARSAQYVSRDVVGLEDLDEHGEWIREPEYGYVWRPAYVSYGWAPYRYGRWVYVSPWGWSWIDDARWGFAPFHYGRWAHIRNRWCWVPGPRHIRPVYAPALVGWVGGPSVSVSVSFGSVGWYPLGPRDFYYPGYRYTPRYIRYVNISNTYFINHNHFYGRHLPPPRFDYRLYPGAVTFVPRDRFVGGRRISDHWVRLGDDQLRNVHAERRPPAIAPYRESVLAGQLRRRPPAADRFNARGRGDYFAGRVPFHRERDAIENNGGRPLTRNELIDRSEPKRGGDFRAIRPGGAGDIKRADRERALGLNSGFNGDNRRPRELNNDSVREWQSRRNRDNQRQGATGLGQVPRSPGAERQRERLEIMRAEDSSRSAPRSNDHIARQPNTNSLRQGTTSYYRPPSSAREPSRGSMTPNRIEPRQFTQPRSEPRSYSPPRVETRRNEARPYSPPPRREFSSPPRSEPRALPRVQPQPRTQPQPSATSQPRSVTRPAPSSPSRSNHGGSGNRGANRPHASQR